MLFLAFCSKANDLTITYLSPSGLEVCQDGDFAIIVENTSTDTTKNITIDIQFPNGLDYVPSSVNGANATEQNITDLNHPVFALPNFLAGQKDTFWITAKAGCDLVTDINNGVIFQNQIVANYTGGTKNITTLPYNIETALLVISQVMPVTTAGFICDDVLTRTVTIRNTRPGALDTLYFVDDNGGGLAITSVLGTPVIGGPGEYRLMLTSADFMSIGDGDGLFEFNEIIVITENITIVACGGTVTSDLRAEWGCGNSICQFDNNIGAIGVNTCPLQANLEFRPVSNFDDCYCGDNAVPQRMVIKNIGDFTASLVQFGVNALETYDDYFINAIDDSTITITVNGVTTPLFPFFKKSMTTTTCFQPNDLQENVRMVLPDIAPGDSVILDWQMYFCAEACTDMYAGWRYEHGYFGACSAYTSGDNLPVGIKSFGSVIMPSFVKLQNAETVDVAYDFFDTAQVVNQTNGYFNTKMELPCGVVWDNDPNDFEIDGQAAYQINYDTTARTIEVKHTLPLNSNLPTMNFSLDLDCNASCPIVDSIYTLDIQTFLFFDSNCDTTCRGLEFCSKDLTIEIDCFQDTLTDTLVGIAFNDDSYYLERVNYGQVDNDNNSVPDASGTMNMLLVAQQRAMVGDTIREVMSGKILDEFQNQYQYAKWRTEWKGGVSSADLYDPDKGISMLSSTVSIYDSSTNVNYTCPNVDFSAYSTVDTLIYYVNMDVSHLSSLGCLPASFRYEENDSIHIESIYKLRYNVADPQTQFNHNAIQLLATPELMLSDANYFPDFYSFEIDTFFDVMEYSGYRVFMNLGTAAVRPCEANDFTGLNSIQFYLADPNFFPYEVREFARITDLGFKPDPNFQLDTTRLTFAGIPEASILLLNQGVPVSHIDPVDSVYNYDITGFSDTIFDEGFYYFTQNIVSGPCTNNGFFDAQLSAKIQLSKELNDSIVNTVRINSSGIRTLNPILSHATLLPNLVATTDTVCWEFSVTNSPNNVGSLQSKEAFNLWFHPVSPDGTLATYEIIDLATNLPISSTNGIYTYGDLLKNETRQFRICVINSGCGIETMELNYGWNCSIYTNPLDTACYQSNIDLTVESVRPELEMVITNPAANTFPLCTNIPYHIAKVFNAELGTAKNVSLEVILPQGLDIVGGTCELSYPDGSVFVPIPDPVLVSGNVYEWDISALQASIGANGLQNINKYPDNMLHVRFNVIADCDFIGGTYITFRGKADNQCFSPINSIRRAGNPINISGAIAAYNTSINVIADTATGCANTVSSRIDITTTGITGSNDSIFITLPAGVTYFANSYSPLANAINSAPSIEIKNGLQVLKWKMNTGLSAGSTISFNIQTEGYINFACGDELLLFVQTVSPANALCVATNTICNILVSTGNAQHGIKIERAVLDITSLQFVVSAAGNQEYIQRAMTIQNNGAALNGPVIITYYHDVNGDGQITAADLLLHSQTMNLNIAAGGFVNLSSNNTGFYTTPGMACNIIAVIDPAGNCICSGSQSAATTPIRFNVLPLVQGCPNTDISVGIAPIAGYTYDWQTNFVQCDTCSMTQVNIDNPNGGALFYSFIQRATTSTGCIIDYVHTVSINPTLTANLDSVGICLGDTTQVTAGTTGTNYTWTGENITDPNSATTTIQPTTNQWYNLMIVDNLGCTFMDSTWLTVHSVTADAGSDVGVCDNATSAQLAAVVDPNYTYHWTPYATITNPFISNPIAFPSQTTTYQLVVTDENGCEDTDFATVFVSNAPAPTSENQNICFGEDLNYNGSILDQSGSYTFTLQAWNGCDSVHTLNLTVLDTSFQQQFLEICQGDSVELGGTFYNQSGTYCHDFVAFNGCDSTICLTLNVTNNILTNSSTTLCFGDTLVWNNQTYTVAGDYFQTFASTAGCDSVHRTTLDFYDEIDADLVSQIDIPIGQSTMVEILGGNTYQWFPTDFLSCTDCPNPTITPLDDITYQIVVMDQNGCSEILFLAVSAPNNCIEDKMGIPNAISPNNDGVNDEFGVISPYGINNFSMRIYNRWGEKVYETTDPNDKWDAKINGRNQAQDAYVYVIQGDCYQGEEFYFKGSFIIIR